MVTLVRPKPMTGAETIRQKTLTADSKLTLGWCREYVLEMRG